MNDKDRLDSCCRSLHKCDASKNVELTYSNDRNIPHCECVHSFRSCLKNLNTSLSNELASIHSINITQCLALDYPMIKCAKFEEYSISTDERLGSMSSTELNRFFDRCIKYELDENQPQKLQLFDIPFIYHETFIIAGN